MREGAWEAIERKASCRLTAATPRPYTAACFKSTSYHTHLNLLAPSTKPGYFRNRWGCRQVQHLLTSTELTGAKIVECGRQRVRLGHVWQTDQEVTLSSTCFSPCPCTAGDHEWRRHVQFRHEAVWLWLRNRRCMTRDAGQRSGHLVICKLSEDAQDMRHVLSARGGGMLQHIVHEAHAYPLLAIRPQLAGDQLLPHTPLPRSGR